MKNRIRIALALTLLSFLPVLPALAIPGQTVASASGAHASPRFQVATIKPSTPEESRLMQIRGNRFVTNGTSVVDLLKYACGLQEEEIVGGPNWLKTAKFDLVADPETQVRPSSDEYKMMVQNLLADRLHLVAHRETKVLPVFEIVPARSGPKLKPSRGPVGGIPAVGHAQGELAVVNATLPDIAKFLQRFVTDRPVVDETGISGRYDVTLRWTPDETLADHQGAGLSESYPGFFTAIQEQIGLKLEASKRPVQVLVIDHIDLPSEN